MKVYYSGNYWGGHKFEHAGKEISVKKEFVWGGQKWHIPAAYACARGLVIDFCVEIPKEQIETYLNHWNQEERISVLDEEELERMKKESPFSIEVDIQAGINGKELESSGMCAVGWHPIEIEREMIEDVQEELMEAYHCDRNQGWWFIRASFPWKTARRPKINKLSLTLKKHPTVYPGGHFTTSTSCEKQEVNLIHPASKQEYKLTIHECETVTLSEKSFRHMKDMQFPNLYNRLTYSILPELTQREFRIQDCARSDKPKKIGVNSDASVCGISVLGGADGPTTVFIADKDSKGNNKQMACSALHFIQAAKVEWRTVFYTKEDEDYSLEIYL